MKNWKEKFLDKRSGEQDDFGDSQNQRPMTSGEAEFYGQPNHKGQDAIAPYRPKSRLPTWEQLLKGAKIPVLLAALTLVGCGGLPPEHKPDILPSGINKVQQWRVLNLCQCIFTGWEQTDSSGTVLICEPTGQGECAWTPVDDG